MASVARKWPNPVVRGIALLVATLALAACGGAEPADDTDGGGAAPTATEGGTEVTEGGTEVTEEEAADDASDDIVRIGLNIPISGPVAHLGSDYQEGATLAVEEINAAGGIDGRDVELVNADGECAPGPAVTAARHLADTEDVDVMMGQICSSAGLAVMEVLPEVEVANLTVMMTHPALTEQAGAGGNPWLFRLNVSDAVMAVAYTEYIQEQGTETVFIFGEDTDFGRGGAEIYEQQFADAGIEITGTEFVAQGTPDYRPILTRVEQQDPDALLLILNWVDAEILMRQFRELGLTQQVFARGSVVTPEFLDATSDDPSIGEGMTEAAMWSFEIESEGNDALKEAYRERWDRDATLVGAMAYYGVKTIEQAVLESGRDDPHGIRDGLEQVDFMAGLGPVKFDENHQAHPWMALSTITDGQIVLEDVLETGP